MRQTQQYRDMKSMFLKTEPIKQMKILGESIFNRMGENQTLLKKKDEKWGPRTTDQVNKRMGNTKKNIKKMNNDFATF